MFNSRSRKKREKTKIIIVAVVEAGPSRSLKHRVPEMLHRLEFHAMGCEMLALVDRESTSVLLANVPEWFEEWEQVLSRFRYDSELTRLNQIHEQPVHVSEPLWDVFRAARSEEH